MVAAALACALSAMLADPFESTPAPDPHAAYEAARAKAGRNPEAQVELALWCERNGLDAERLRHLALAVLADPDHAVARGMMGLVHHGGRWIRPEQVAAQVGSDAELAARLSEYRERRRATPETADGHWDLARWCEDRGLRDEAKAHLAAVVRLDPGRKAAWRRLGCVEYHGRWMPPEEAESARVEALARRKADPIWRRRLETWKDRLGRGILREATERELAAVTDPLAIPAVWRALALGDAADQARAVQIFGQIDAPAASRALAAMAVLAPSDEARRAATESLVHRDPREAVQPLMDMLADQVKHEFIPVGGPGQPGGLLIEGPRANVLRIYAPPPMPELALAWVNPTWRPRGRFVGRDVQGRAVDSNTLRQETQQAALAAQALLEADIQTIREHNAAVARRNAGVGVVLANLTPEDLGDEPERWRRWWMDRLGFTYRPDDRPKPTVTYNVPLPIQPRQFAVVDGYRESTSCFAAGTPVLTREGPRPIEEIRVGDVVLAQDPASGALGYHPVTTTYHNPPTPTVRVEVQGDDEPIVATGIHRFWKAGRGWVMARDLRPGDSIRILGGVATVASVSLDAVRPVFNLDVDGARTFFIGQRGLLVHDNSIPGPTAKLFDAERSLSAE
jgi:hypothetical protein